MCNKMNTIQSFKVNHDLIDKGIFLSRRDRNTYTLDLRLAKPNCDSVKPEALHTIEHLGATFLRNSAYSQSVVYFGPMGCLTGCYVIFFDDLPLDEALALIKQTFSFISTFECEIPGSKRCECGNYLFHDLPEARRVASSWFEAVKNKTIADTVYPS